MKDAVGISMEAGGSSLFAGTCQPAILPPIPDDPLMGYEDSVAGRFLPPGRAGDRLMVYDLNKIQDEPSKGRIVAVPDGANYQEITLHKVIVGGDPGDLTISETIRGASW